jgi:hypothetical protein
MKRFLTLASVILLLVMMGGTASAQTPTATASATNTATPSVTATPSAVPTPTCAAQQGIFYNGVPAGAGSGSPTPVPVGTSTPVAVLPCNCGLQYVKFLVKGGTVGTDGCWITWSSKAQCAANSGPGNTISGIAIPAPNASTFIGDFAPTGLDRPLIYNPTPSTVTSSTVPYWMGGEADAVCTAASMSVSVIGVKPNE